MLLPESLTLRQYYAGQALAGLMANPSSMLTNVIGEIQGVLDPETIAFDKADKMIRHETENPPR